MINNRIFVVGCPRSGTTLLQGLLNTHPEITSFTESHFYDFGIKRPKNGPLYYVSRNAKKLVLSFLKENSIDEEVKNQILNQMPDLPKIPGKDVTSWAKYFISILDAITINRNMSIWLEKTPDHLNRIALIRKICPEAHFLHILRNGKDVVASLYKASIKWRKNYSIKECIQFWNKAVTISTDYLNHDQHHYLFYDDLAKSPQKNINHIFSILNIPKVENIDKKYKNSVTPLLAKDEVWKKKNLTSIQYSSTFKTSFKKAERNFIEKSLYLNIYEQLKINSSWSFNEK